MTFYIAIRFSNFPEQLLEPFNVSSPDQESILEKRVYHDYTIFVNHKGTMTGLVELDMIYFDVILGMD